MDTISALGTPLAESTNSNNIGDDLFEWDVHGKTRGVLGFGRIGQAVARRAALGFEMPVIYHDPFDVTVPSALDGRAQRASFDDVLARADIVALTLPLSDETRGLMDARAFLTMKPGAIFVNGSRGAIVREDALPAALDSGHLRAALMCLPSNRCRTDRRCATTGRSRRCLTSARPPTRRVVRWPNSQRKTCCARSTAQRLCRDATCPGCDGVATMPHSIPTLCGSLADQP